MKFSKKTSLTARELQVARLLLASKTTSEMSQILGIAEGTISAHLSSVYSFHGVSSRYGFLNLVYSNSEMRGVLINSQVAMTDAVTPETLSAAGADQIVSGRNAPDLSLTLGEVTAYAYPLCIELINSAFDRNMPAILRSGPIIWAGFLQGDLRYVVDCIDAITPADTSFSNDDDEAVAIKKGHKISIARMVAWLYAVRAAALALCGSERQQSNALQLAEVASGMVISSQLLPWTIRITRLFVYACSTNSPLGIDRLRQMAAEIEALNPLRLYILTLALRLAHHIGVTQRTAHREIMLLLVAEAEAAREEIQRRSSSTVFNMRSDAINRLYGPSYVKTSDGRYVNQCLMDDPALDIWLLLEWQILHETKNYVDVIREFPQYREELRRAHAKLHAHNRERLDAQPS